MTLTTEEFNQNPHQNTHAMEGWMSPPWTGPLHKRALAGLASAVTGREQSRETGTHKCHRGRFGNHREVVDVPNLCRLPTRELQLKAAVGYDHRVGKSHIPAIDDPTYLTIGCNAYGEVIHRLRADRKRIRAPKDGGIKIFRRLR